MVNHQHLLGDEITLTKNNIIFVHSPH